MSSEVWFRNADNYIRELVECGQYQIAWDRGYLVKKRIDAVKHAQLYFGQAYPWRILLVGEQGTAEYTAASPLRPVGVYPTWAYGEEQQLLEEILERPVGLDVDLCNMTELPLDERPVLGQQHRVVITDTPPVTSGPGKKFFRYLKELQEDFPDAVIHVHGLYSWRVAFGFGFGSADVEPRTAAHKGKVLLPAGQEVKFELLQRQAHWVKALGFKPADLAVPRNRCMYNIKSAAWAAENYASLYNFPTQASSKPVDSDSSDATFVRPTTKLPIIGSKKAQPGDEYLCNTCSLQNNCRYFRSGAVCSVPGAEPVALAKYFNTRDSQTILDGLGTLMAAQTHRLAKGMQDEEDFGGIDPEVTKMIGQIFDHGVKLAKLLDPSLRGGPKVAINFGAGSTGVSVTSPNQLVSAIYRELELQGHKREDITPKMVEGILEGMSNNSAKRQAIEGQVVERAEDTG